jgi:hypothetical protein
VLLLLLLLLLLALLALLALLVMGLLRCVVLCCAVLCCVVLYCVVDATLAVLFRARGRQFMFGQPSLCYLGPRESLRAAQLSSLVCDFFVNNCEISTAPHG